MIRIFLYDEDAKDMEISTRQLELHGISSGVKPCSNRNELLDAIAGESQASVALIDLQSDERKDNNYSGHRIIETIRRNERLRERCRPLAYTQHARPDVIDLARRHGAYALISKLDLEVPAGEVALAEFLQAQRDRPAASLQMDDDTDVPFLVFPSTARARERAARHQGREEDALNRTLQRIPRITSRAYFWDVIRYLADGLDTTSAAMYVAADYPVRLKTVTNQIDELRGELVPRFTARGVSWEEFAQELLAAMPHRRLAPSPQDMVRVLHRLSAVSDILHDGRLRAASYVDDEALAAIDLVLPPSQELGNPSGNRAQASNTTALLKRLEAIQPDESARASLTSAFVRAVNNIYDAYIASEELRYLGLNVTGVVTSGRRA